MKFDCPKKIEKQCFEEYDVQFYFQHYKKYRNTVKMIIRSRKNQKYILVCVDQKLDFSLLNFASVKDNQSGKRNID